MPTKASDQSAQKKRNRFFYINHIIQHVASSAMSEQFPDQLEEVFKNSLIHIWDGFKYVLLEQGVIQSDDPLFGSKSRRGRTSGAVSLSKEQVYCEEIVSLAKKAKTFDPAAMYEKYGKYKKNGKKSKAEESMIQPSQGNLPFTKNSETLSNINEDDENGTDSESVSSFESLKVNDNNQTNNQLEQSILEMEDNDDGDNNFDRSVIEQRRSQIYNKNRQLHSSTVLNNSLNSSLPGLLSNFQMPQLPALANPNQSYLNNVPSFSAMPNPASTLYNNPTNPYLNQTAQQNANPTQSSSTSNNLNLGDIAAMITNVNKNVTDTSTELKTSIKKLSDRVGGIEKTANQNVEDIRYLKKKLESQTNPNSEEITIEINKLKEARKNLSAESITRQIDEEIKAALAKSKNEIGNSVSNRLRTQSTPYQQSRKPTAIWGESKDTTNDDIARVYVFAASKIPKQECYSEGWFKRSTQEAFDKNKLQAEIITVEQVPANFQTAKTKTFKVLVKAKEGLNPDDFLNSKNWLRGIKITRFKRPRSNTALPSTQEYRHRSSTIYQNEDNRLRENYQLG